MLQHLLATHEDNHETHEKKRVPNKQLHEITQIHVGLQICKRHEYTRLNMEMDGGRLLRHSHLVQLALLVSPVGNDLDEELEVYPRAEQLLDIGACFGSDLL